MALTPDDARQIADELFEASRSIDQFLDEQFQTISRPEYEAINESGRTLLRLSSFMTTSAVGLSIEAMSDDAAELKEVIAEANEALKVLKDVRKGIRLAAGLADLATAILSKDPGAVLKATGSLRETLKA